MIRLMPVKIIIKALFLGILFSTILLSCERDLPTRNFPRIRTFNVSDIINAEGATFNGAVMMFQTASLEDHGFVWSVGKDPKLGSAEVVHLGERLVSGEFRAEIKTTLRTDIEYFVRAFAIVNEVIVYGDEISFVSLGSMGPRVLSTDPKFGNMGDTLLIMGENFSSFSSKNKVKFGEIDASILYSSPDSLLAIVPNILKRQESEVKVSVLGNVSSSNANFGLNPPIIKEVSPLNVVSGDTVFIIGNNFVNGFTSIRLGEVELRPKLPDSNIRSSRIYILFPDTITQRIIPVEVKVFSQSTIADDSLKNMTPEISNFYPKSGNVLDTITFKGSYLSGVTNVYLGGLEANILMSSSADSIRIIVPNELNTQYSQIEIFFKQSNSTFSKLLDEFFELKPPRLLSVSKNKAMYREELTIFGANFNPASTVYFGNVKAEIKSVASDTIHITVPDISLTPINIKIVSAEQNSLSPNKFELIGPNLTGISNISIEVGDTVEVYGTFNPIDSINTLLLDDRAITQILEFTEQRLKVIIPMPNYLLSDHEVKLKVGQNIATLVDLLNIREPMVNSVTPATIGFMDSLQLNGYFPISDVSFYEVRLGNVQLDVVSVEGDKMLVINKNLIPRGTYNLNLKVEEYNVPIPGLIGIPWKKFNNLMELLPFFTFVIDDRVFGGFVQETGQSYLLYEMNTGNLSWTKRADIPEEALISPAFKGFTISGKGYIGFNSSGNRVDWNQRFWQYDPVLDSWSEKKPYPLRFEDGYSFEVNGRGYIGTGVVVDTSVIVSSRSYLWEYDPNNDNWISKNSFPGPMRKAQKSFSIGTDGYIVGGEDEFGNRFNELWMYDSSMDTWSKKTDFPEPFLDRSVAFSLLGIGYVGMRTFEQGMWTYNPLIDTWNKVAKPGNFVKSEDYDFYYSVLAIISSGRAYYFSSEGNPYQGYDLQIWELDPVYVPQ